MIRTSWCGKVGAGQRLAARIERDDCGIFGNRRSKPRGFLADAIFAAAAAALCDFDDLDRAEPQLAADGGSALAITRREIAFGPRFQPADRGDDELHPAPPGEGCSARPSR